MPSLSIIALAAALAATAAAQQPTCDVVGYDSGSILAYLVREDEALADRLACGTLCAGDPQCASFAFGGGACLLYEESVAGNVYEVEDSPFTFNDVACVEGEVEVPEEPPVEDGEPPAEGEEPAEGDDPVEEPPVDDAPVEESPAGGQ